MINYWNIRDCMRPTAQGEPGCWMRVVMPTDDELQQVRTLYPDLPDYFLEDVADFDERARYDADSGWQLIIVRVPYAKETQSRTPFITVPLGIMIKGEHLVTVCHYNVQLVSEFITRQQQKGGSLVDVVDFVFHIFYLSSTQYLKYLRQINQRLEKAKQGMDTTIDNDRLIALSRLQDSLTYFITSLKGNDSLLAKVKTKLPVDELDSDLIDDVNIEMNQAIETAQIYATILDSTMETYSSIISNNVNAIMKVLTSVSILLMLPTLIASFMGMNLVNGAETAWWGFPLAIGLSLLVSLLGWYFFRRKHLI